MGRMGRMADIMMLGGNVARQDHLWDIQNQSLMICALEARRGVSSLFYTPTEVTCEISHLARERRLLAGEGCGSALNRAYTLTSFGRRIRKTTPPMREICLQTLP